MSLPSSDGAAVKHPRLAILVSYFYLKQDAAYLRLIAAIAPFVDVLVDSGAFSDMMAGRNRAAQGTAHTIIRVEDYSAWLKEYGALWWNYVALDKIYDPVQTRRNFDVMVAAGLRPMPVLTYPEDPAAMRDLVKVNPYVCIAGGLEADAACMHQRIQRTFAATDGVARIHGLGYVQWPDLFQLPLYSVDASSWLGGSRYGSVAMFDPTAGIVAAPWTEVAAKRATPRAARLARYLSECGITYRMGADKDHWRRNSGIPAMVTAAAHLQFQQFAAHRGRTYFLVTAGPNLLRLLVSALAGMANGEHFNYPAARAHMLRLSTLSVTKQPHELAEAVVAVLRQHTTWQQPHQSKEWRWPPAAPKRRAAVA